jgi:predicted ester cyclase
MSPEANKEVVRRFYEEVINELKLDLIPELVSAGYTEVMDGHRYEVGIEGAKAHALGVRETYPDLHLSIDRQIAEAEWVVTCITASGTHSGEWLGIAPTGKKVRFTGVNVDRVLAGKLVEHGGAANMLGPLLEIGAIRVVGRGESTS